MLYYAVPKLSIFADGLEGVFAIAWLSFALMVIAGNLTAMLYSPKRMAKNRQSQQLKRKSRSFY
jgi:hypothetical protein